MYRKLRHREDKQLIQIHKPYVVEPGAEPKQADSGVQVLLCSIILPLFPRKESCITQYWNTQLVSPSSRCFPR